jgi:DNA-binding NarL/FixJ family response regulator
VTRVLLVDDQALMRTGIRIILNSEPGIEVVGEAANGTDGVRLAIELNPDVICMDVQMPVMDGLEATRVLAADDRVTGSILMLTTFDDDEYLFEALDAGASGFLLKTASPEKLVEAVQVVAAGESLLSPAVTRRVIERFSNASRGVTERQDLPELTDREVEVLALLARGHSNAEIAAELYVGEATVKTHVSNVLAKLGVRDRIRAVVWAYENGFAVPGQG